MQAELKALSQLLDAPDCPIFPLVGGAQISTKLDLLVDLMSRVRTIGIGGAMDNTFLAAQGVSTGKSLVERETLNNARQAIRCANETGCSIVLPVYVVVAREFNAGTATRTVSVDQVGADKMISGTGPATVAHLLV